MNPAFSVIFFTTASGAGYGLLIVLGLFGAAGALPPQTWFAATAMLVALGLISAGLLASTLHLGHPERAWRAMSQWKTSWLSREGVMALVTYGPALLFAAAWIFPHALPLPLFVAGPLAALCAAATLYTTAMIYGSLKPIRAWHNKYVVPGYLTLGPMTGAVVLLALSEVFGVRTAFLAPVCGLLLAAGLTVKWLYWSDIDSAPSAATRGTATGLGRASVRSIEWPHTEANYVVKEMGFVIARRHAARLRQIAMWAGFLLPGVLIESTILLPAPLPLLLAIPALLLTAVGIVVERWLFFAEAKHAVMLYY